VDNSTLGSHPRASTEKFSRWGGQRKKSKNSKK